MWEGKQEKIQYQYYYSGLYLQDKTNNAKNTESVCTSRYAPPARPYNHHIYPSPGIVRHAHAVDVSRGFHIGQHRPGIAVPDLDGLQVRAQYPPLGTLIRTNPGRSDVRWRFARIGQGGGGGEGGGIVPFCMRNNSSRKAIHTIVHTNHRGDGVQGVRRGETG